jgi:hypothetical protein
MVAVGVGMGVEDRVQQLKAGLPACLGTLDSCSER